MSNVHDLDQLTQQTQNYGLYTKQLEHDSCGVGFIAHIHGKAQHEIVLQGLQLLHNLDHRGAVGADKLMGDGVGMMLQLPHQLFREEFAVKNITLPAVGEYGVGMVFLPREQSSQIACIKEIERAIKHEGQELLGWRDVPIDTSVPMSERVKAKEPVIKQVFIGRGKEIIITDALERKLYVIRKSASHAIQKLKLFHGQEYFVASMSARTIVYKGLLLSAQLGQYFRDLIDPRTASAFALVHQRFSTNTFPEWPLAHPYRLMAHNGEINTVRGNYNWTRAREGAITSPVLGNDLQKLWPLIYPGQSDTACFDNCLELLTMSGYPLAQAMMMMIPEAWEQHTTMDAQKRAFYEYYAAMMEPWDGPAAIAFSDGKQIGAMLDRNGLRPARYIETTDDLVIMASEVGVLPIAEKRIRRKWRLQPGKMFLIDMEVGGIIDDAELKKRFAYSRPYQTWIENLRIKLTSITTEAKASQPSQEHDAHMLKLETLQHIFGYTQEDLKFLLAPMAQAGEEAVGSMGNDSPLAVLSQRSKLLYHYFRQLFAQVTNPPIDPIREQLVMSLVSFVGPRPNLLDINQVNPPIRLELTQPILDFADMEKLRVINQHTHGKFLSREIDICYPKSWGKEGIEARLAYICAEAVDALREGVNILIITDRYIHPDRVAIPALLAMSAVHQHLINLGLRTQTGLIVETASAREVHHFAVLAGYGAEAIHPYLALQTVSALHKDLPGDLSADKAMQNYIKAIGKGLLKIMSKMGISTYMSYCGAQIFEAVGINQATIDRYFSGTLSRVEGIGIFEMAQEAIDLHTRALSADPLLAGALDTGGEYAWRTRGQEHLWSPLSISTLQHATRTQNLASYQSYSKLINEQNTQAMTLRGLFTFKPAQAIDIDEVEPASEIVKRFATGAMSLGSISTEAHSSLAVAMNRIGGKSNTGEGGEDVYRYRAERSGKKIRAQDKLENLLPDADIQSAYALKNNDSLRSRIKQVASGRFGVTAEYLTSADQIQIKMAQGAKPGEGGQLPGHKVSEYIAKLRFSVPGVGLISPPPHHDIYSIEDLAQLIHDLKNVNPDASISVKLVSEIGVGTVAAGVAKCKADHVTISGHDGGTGASPWSSIKHAGSPWEIGLAETQQILVMNGLRGRIAVQVDGQLKTGRDVVIGAMLGADEFGFATAPLVTQGCIMMRKCHLNTCPVGVATQDPVLRKKFSGKPEYLINYFFFVAEEARQIMAQHGIRSINELIGRSDLLDMQRGLDHWKTQGLDFSRIFYKPQVHESIQCFHSESQDHGLGQALDKRLIKRAKDALDKGEKADFIERVSNVNRSVGAMLSGEVAKRYGHKGLPDNTIYIRMQGTGGQSFGAFLAHGITLDLCGDANDYTGKGLSGGRIIVQPSHEFRGNREENIIVGNTVLYGATSGSAFFSGVSGERFAVRNSGAQAVVEGVGDHGCEYMTGGTVVVLGQTGRNFAAGMSGGVAYVYDPDKQFEHLCNHSMVRLERVLPAAEQAKFSAANTWHMQTADEVLLRQLLEEHQRWSGSPLARLLLDDWHKVREHFVKVMPDEYKRALAELASKPLARSAIEKVQKTAHASSNKVSSRT